MEAYIATVGVSGADKGQRSGRRPSDGHRTPALRSDRRYLRYKLSFRDLVEMMAEGGSCCRIRRRFEKRWNHFASPAGRSRRVDETYVKIRGEWVYLYRAVDKQGKTIDFRLSPRRDVAAAKAFFRKALKTQDRTPESVTLDGYAASHRAIHEMPHEDLAWLRDESTIIEIPQQHVGTRPPRREGCASWALCSASRTLIMPRPQLRALNCCIVFARASSPWGVCAFRGELRLRSGTRCSPLDLLATSRNRHARSFQFAPEPQHALCTTPAVSPLKQILAVTNTHPTFPGSRQT